MTLNDLLNESEFSAEEIAAEMEYKRIKNSITEDIRDINRYLDDTVARLVKEVAEDAMYANVSGYCCSCNDKIEIPENDKKELLTHIYKRATKRINIIEKEINSLVDVSDKKDAAEDEEKPSAVEHVKEIIAPIAQAVATAAPASDMFGY